MNVKIFLLVVLLVSLIAFWLVPVTNFGRRLKMGEKTYYAVHIIGICCGTIGFVVSFFFPDIILKEHYYELILLPVLIGYLYTAIIIRVRKTEHIYDEKQQADMTRAGATAWITSVVLIFLLYAMYREGIIEGAVWFPLYIFSTFTAFSASTLYYYRKT